MVVLDDGPEEQVAVHLKGGAVAPDGVVVDFFAVAGAIKIRVGETQGRAQLLEGLKEKVEIGRISLALERVILIVVDAVRVAVTALEVQLLEDLGVTTDPPAAQAEALVGEDFVAQDGVEAYLRLARHAEAQHQVIVGLKEVTGLVQQMVAPPECIEFLEKLGLGINIIHDQHGDHGDAGAGHVTRVDAEILAQVEQAEVDEPVPVAEVVAQAKVVALVVTGVIRVMAQAPQGAVLQEAGLTQPPATVDTAHAVTVPGKTAVGEKTPT